MFIFTFQVPRFKICPIHCIIKCVSGSPLRRDVVEHRSGEQKDFLRWCQEDQSHTQMALTSSVLSDTWRSTRRCSLASPAGNRDHQRLACDDIWLHWSASSVCTWNDVTTAPRPCPVSKSESNKPAGLMWPIYRPVIGHRAMFFFIFVAHCHSFYDLFFHWWTACRPKTTSWSFSVIWASPSTNNSLL